MTRSQTLITTHCQAFISLLVILSIFTWGFADELEELESDLATPAYKIDRPVLTDKIGAPLPWKRELNRHQFSTEDAQCMLATPCVHTSKHYH